MELPDAESRSQILKVILRKTTLSDDVDLVRLARMTNGYSGKDLKVKFIFILCYDVSAKVILIYIYSLLVCAEAMFYCLQPSNVGDI